MSFLFSLIIFFLIAMQVMRSQVATVNPAVPAQIAFLSFSFSSINPVNLSRAKTVNIGINMYMMNFVSELA
jgi:hypothetical protein